MHFYRFSFAPFYRSAGGRRARSALAGALRSAIAAHSLRRLRELFDLHPASAFAQALGLLPLRAQLDALSLLPATARWQLWPYLPAELRRHWRCAVIDGDLLCAC